MKLHELEKNIGATHAKKRVGRGSGSGLGKTSGRRLPKRGFSNYPFKKEYAVINLSDLNVFEDGTVVTPALLKERGIVKKQLSGIKVLGEGQLEKKLTVQAHKFSKSAIDKINESGSKAEVI